jgi:hypothetical protein
MRIRLTNPALVPELRQHFERSGFITNRLGDEAIDVWRPDAPSKEQSQREVEVHLAVWRTRHPDTVAEASD